MRATRVLRCTRCTGSSSGRRSAWALGHFWDERAYLASPNAKKQLMTVALMAALGYTSATATTNPPATVIGSAGTLQYAAHNLVQQSENISAAWWSATNGSATNATTYAENTSNAIHRFYPNGPASVAAGSTVTVAASLWAGTRRYVAIGANNSNDDVFVVVDTQTWTITQSSARGAGVNLGSKLTSVGNGEYRVSVTGYIPGIAQYFPIVMASDTGTPGSLVYSYIGNSSTIIVSKLQHNWGYPVDYVPTTTAPVYAAPITYDRGASSNAITYSDVWQSGTWIANVSPTDGGAGALIDGYQTARFTASGGASGYFRAIAGSPIPSGETFWVAHYVNRVSGAGTFTGGCDALGSLVFNPSTGQLTSGPAVSGVKAVAGGWLIFGKYTGNGTANSLVAFGGSAATVFDVATWVVRGASLTPYLKTGPTAPLYTAGTPKSQNLLSNSDPAQSPWLNDGSVTTTTTAGETRIQFSGANQGRYVQPTVTPCVGCVYTFAFDVKATSTDVGNTISVGSGGTSQTITLTAAYQTIYLAAVANGANAAAVFQTYAGATARDITVRNVRVYEGTAQLPYVATTGTPYSLYYQQGLITEPARTRETLHPRDLTQAAWVKTTLTAAKTAMGIDGVASSATTLTAAATPGYAIQTVTSASANRLFHLRARSRSATTVKFQISVDGGVTLVDCYATPQWQTFSTAKAAVTNPQYVVYLINNGDSIDVDFAQGEQYTTLPAVPPMPIWGTESAAQSKSADLVIGPAGLVSTAGPQTLAVRATATNGNTGVSQFILTTGGAGRALYITTAGEAGNYDGTSIASTGAILSGVPFCAASRYGGSVKGVSLNGGAIVTSAFDGSMGSGGAVGIGHDGSGGNIFSGLIGSIEIANAAFNDANLQRAAQGLVA